MLIDTVLTEHNEIDDKILKLKFQKSGSSTSIPFRIDVQIVY